MDKTAITIGSYNDSADTFAAKFMDYAPYKSRVLYFQKKYVSQAKSIIDLGCGPGNISKLFYEQNPHYEITGIDLSEKMVKIAKQNVPSGAFHVCDLRSIDLHKSYDAAIASFCIVHLSNEENENFLRSLSKIINPSGYLYLSFMEGCNAQYESTCFSKKEIYFNYFPRNIVLNLLTMNSFKIEELFEQGYEENNGSITKDIFVIAQKTAR